MLSKFSAFVRVTAAPIGQDVGQLFLEVLPPASVVVAEWSSRRTRASWPRVGRLDGAGEAALEIELQDDLALGQGQVG